MNVIYVSFFYPKCLDKELIKLGSVVDFPGYTFQKALVAGLDYYYPNMTMVSSAWMSSYPKAKRIWFNKQSYSHNNLDQKRDVFVGLINLPLIKIISEFWRIRKGIKEKIVKGEDNIVILYELHSPFMLAVASLRSKLTRTCLIVPDLPEFMSENSSVLYKLAKKIDSWFINWSIKAFDCFVLFSPHMRERMRIGAKPWTQMEGIYNELIQVEDVEKENKKTILYTGNLSSRVGIKELLKAFSMIDSEDYRLWIRGGVRPSKEILEATKKDKRVVYFDPMSKEDLLILQHKATVLINPVRPSKLFTRYFFPSKTMEYLASGTPTIMYKLDCLPKEYYNHIFFIEKETIENMRDTLVKVCEKPQNELRQFGNDAREFILNCKNSRCQAKIIVDLINSVNDLS